MKKTAIFLGIAALLSASFSSCSSKGASGETETDNTLTVDSILAQPDSFVGKTITVEGVVSHLSTYYIQATRLFRCAGIILAIA